MHIILPDSGHINYFRNPTGNHVLIALPPPELSLNATGANSDSISKSIHLQATIEISSIEIPERRIENL